MAGQMPGNRTLAGTGRTIDRDNRPEVRLTRARKVRLCAHPRFFVRCLAGAVKPNRLLLPAFAPAVRAGFRLLREERTSVRASFLGALLFRRRLPLRDVELGLPAGLPECPLRWLMAEVGLPFRPPEATFGEWLRPLLLPLLWTPLVWDPLPV